jgi:formate hydrogenlyase subunit 4
MDVALSFSQGILILLIAPLTTGLVRKFRALLQGRVGAPILLPYLRLLTLLRKEMVLSKTVSWVFHCVPFVVVGTAAFLCFVLPLLTNTAGWTLNNFMVIASLLAMNAIFLVLGGLDVGSAFGGMGSSREMTIASLIEPATITIFSAFAIASGSADVGGMLEKVAGVGLLTHPYLLLSVFGLMLVALAENARYPVDNPATHLELTMVHEAMILEYSGSYLALLEYASSLKLTLFALLIANIFVPFPFLTGDSMFGLSLLYAIAGLLLKLIVTMFLLALLETSIPKMRFYRMQEYLSYAFFIAFAGFALALFFS